MTLPDFLSLIVMTMALAVCCYELADVHRAPFYRKLVRAMKGVLLFYFFALYAFAYFGPDNILVKTGVMSRSGLIIIFFIMAIDTWTLRRNQDRGPHA